MRDATALEPRVEIRVPEMVETIVAGWRRGGYFSIYFGSDPVYHFDGEGRLRRAFLQGDLYRTQGTTLARLKRVREDGGTQLVRHDLASHELSAFLRQMTDLLLGLGVALERQKFRILECIPKDADVLRDLLRSLAGISQSDPPLSARIKT